jgi:hypothetical protein
VANQTPRRRVGESLWGNDLTGRELSGRGVEALWRAPEEMVPDLWWTVGGVMWGCRTGGGQGLRALVGE